MVSAAALHTASQRDRTTRTHSKMWLTHQCTLHMRPSPPILQRNYRLGWEGGRVLVSLDGNCWCRGKQEQVETVGKGDTTAHFLHKSSPPCLPDQRRKFNGPPIESDDSEDRTLDSSASEQPSHCIGNTTEHSPNWRHQSVLVPYGGYETLTAQNYLSYPNTSRDKQDDYARVCISSSWTPW